VSDTVIRINGDGRVTVEQDDGGIKSFKQIDPNTLIGCINSSLLRGSVSSGLLPRGCLSFIAGDIGEREVCLVHPERRANISYYGTEYKDFPLPRLVFGFRISKEGRVSSCRLGVVADTDNLKPDSPMYRYPLSNVSGFHLCTGNNVLPRCASLHTLGSLPYYIMAMPNNNDHFRAANNKLGLEMRDLLELLKDKEPAFYYSNVLLLNGAVLNDFINGRSL
jgi:hypothetical protein